MKLVFYFPWSEVSGGPYYLSRLANSVADKGIYDVYYTDYPHGLANGILKNKNIKILKYQNEGKNFEIFPNEPVIVVMAVYWAHMVPVVHPDTKLVFFNWHNECMPVLKGNLHCTTRYLKNMIRFLHEKSSVFFLDKTHWMAQNADDIVFREEYVPIVIPKREKQALAQLISKKERNIAVLGRLCKDKIYAVLDLMDNIVNLRDDVKTNVYIIGEGDWQHLLFDQHFPSWIKIIRCGTMDNEKVLHLLSRKTDILFAMGTSILDGASLGIPSVVIPNDVEPFECNAYVYLNECNGYMVGWGPNQLDKLNLPTHTIEEIFDDVYGKDRKAEIGDKCYQYYLANHTDNREAFIHAIDKSCMTGGDFKKFKSKNINWKYCLWKIRDVFYTYRGVLIRQYTVCHFPVYTYTWTTSVHRNIFILGIPVLRLCLYGAKTSVSLLPLIWCEQAVVRSLRWLKRT